MQIVPIIPQQTTGVTESRDVKGVAAVKAALPVQEHELPSLQNNAEQTFRIIREVAHQEKRIVSQHEERRRLCRRIRHSSLLEALRSSVDRRRRKQRNTDFLEHIDEEV
jgi:hypothetical protein